LRKIKFKKLFASLLYSFLRRIIIHIQRTEKNSWLKTIQASGAGPSVTGNALNQFSMKLSLLNVESPLGRFSPGPFSSFYEHEKFGVFLFPVERIFRFISQLEVQPPGTKPGTV
jgi:hypothetical protein